ncbi:erythromycin biosynthesis sensory transduction protein EryC1 [Nocardiopsis terrae]|uniref:Aminotransferase EvaB n=1 Tax=Nocardiopsis terrae TaxID=372655 RepID=A0ABR9HAE7_9ACTN|nr:DegT/DnrJ/EryC1/StrS family aminotransferase [Nocardiopsis terrae]MBE1455968.1 aminotransferase EvaB [Nocardiopsis terrae]GHC96454.1 erythromycin biosynthesis sensory transduction protein EryC1 [Nocardiopsis terrae]
MTIAVWGYTDEYESERSEILQAVDTVFRSGRLVLGEQVSGFEDAFAAYHGLAHGTGVGNGTDALVLALRALGVGPGDEVVTVANTAAPTVVAIDSVGAVPVFVDVHPDTYLMDVSAVADAVTERTRCLLPVHLYGQCVDMEPLMAVAEEHGLPVLEDCAQAHGARRHGVVAGARGNAAAFSFYPTKVLGAYGDAGAVITGSDDVQAALRRLRYYGMEQRYYVVSTPGYNTRLDEVQAAILRRKLDRLDGYIARRREIAARYAEGFAGTDLVLPAVAPGNDHVYYLYVVRHPQRDRIIKELHSYGIELNISYPWPVHTMAGFEHLGYAPGSLPVTEETAGQIFSLPMYPSLPRESQDRVIEALRTVMAEL